MNNKSNYVLVPNPKQSEYSLIHNNGYDSGNSGDSGYIFLPSFSPVVHAESSDAVNGVAAALGYAASIGSEYVKEYMDKRKYKENTEQYIEALELLRSLKAKGLLPANYMPPWTLSNNVLFRDVDILRSDGKAKSGIEPNHIKVNNNDQFMQIQRANALHNVTQASSMFSKLMHKRDALNASKKMINEKIMGCSSGNDGFNSNQCSHYMDILRKINDKISNINKELYSIGNYK